MENILLPSGSSEDIEDSNTKDLPADILGIVSLLAGDHRQAVDGGVAPGPANQDDLHPGDDSLHCTQLSNSSWIYKIWTTKP